MHINVIRAALLGRREKILTRSEKPSKNPE